MTIFNLILKLEICMTYLFYIFFLKTHTRPKLLLNNLGHVCVFKKNI